MRSPTKPNGSSPMEKPCGDMFCHPEFVDNQAFYCPYHKMLCKHVARNPSFPFHGDGFPPKNKSNGERPDNTFGHSDNELLADLRSEVSNPFLRQY